MNLRIWSTVIATALVVTVGAGCAENRPPDASGGSGAGGTGSATIDFGVGVDPAFAPIYLADQQDLFAREGLDVTITQYPEATGGLDAILARTGRLSASTEASLLNRSTRGDVRGLAVFSQSPSFLKLVARSGVDDVAGIKRYGVAKGTANEYVTTRLLASRGIDRNSVEFVGTSPAEMPALLARGDIDGYIIWEPWPARGVATGGRILLTSGEVGYVYNLVIGVDGAWFEGHKDEAARVVRAVGQACDRIRADRSAAGAATEQAIKVPADEATALLEGVECTVRDFTDDDMRRYGDIARFQAENKIVPTRPDPNTVMIRGVA